MSSNTLGLIAITLVIAAVGGLFMVALGVVVGLLVVMLLAGSALLWVAWIVHVNIEETGAETELGEEPDIQLGPGVRAPVTDLKVA
jgi:fatty acid desaturase